MQSISRAQRQANVDFIVVLPAYPDFRPLKMWISYWSYQHIQILGRWHTSKMNGWATKRWPTCMEFAYRLESHGFRSPRGEKMFISHWFYQHILILERWHTSKMKVWVTKHWPACTDLLLLLLSNSIWAVIVFPRREHHFGQKWCSRLQFEGGTRSGYNNNNIYIYI